MKQCSKCRRWKAVTDFHRSSRSSDGYQWQCKCCNRSSVRASNKKNGHNGYTPYRAERTAGYVAKRRAVLLGNGPVEQIDRRVVWGRDEGHCRIKLVCDGIFVPFDEMHLDHVVPVSKGGTHTWSNVQTGCAPCNYAKSNLLLTT